MKIENKIGQDFNSLAERITYSYVATYPDFKPVDNGVCHESQKQMHDFIGDILLYIYEHTDILGLPNEADAYYENWELNNSKPDLIKAMEKIEGKFAGIIEILIKIGLLGEIDNDKLVIKKEKWSITKPIKEKLERLGISCEQGKEKSVLWLSKYPKIFPAWKSYSEMDNGKDTKISRVMAFIHGRYYGRTYKAVDFFSNLVEDTNLLKDLENYLEKNHFHYDNFELNFKTRYACVRWMKEYPKNETAYYESIF